MKRWGVGREGRKEEKKVKFEKILIFNDIFESVANFEMTVDEIDRRESRKS